MAETTSSRKAVVTLPSDTEILITRVFDAPKHLVYRAWTTPEYIARWWVGDRGVATVVDVDLRVGGTWRYVMTANAGFEVAFHGEYHEVVPNERLVTTEVFEAMPDLPALNVCTFTEEDGRTTVTLLVRHTNKQARDTHLSYGMEGGMNEAFDKLEAIAISLA
ncbi:SRPBCC family protein [Acidothermaceae bacterium B102]|nr:SRPBCC family protein [Acidothermaceae bacterium B102]